MSEPALAILTTTWNRKSLLSRLHASLLKQNAPPTSFEWLVVDDGSTDGTVDSIEQMASKSRFPIRCISKANGGKHTALNIGLQRVQAPWTLIVDSDDWLLENGLMDALSEISQSTGLDQVKGICAPLSIASRPQVVYPTPEETLTYASWYAIRPRVDSSIIFRTAAIRLYPFPEFRDENFISESSVFARLFRDGGLRMSNRVIVAAEYQPGGLSAKSRELRMRNPVGAIYTRVCQLKSGLRGRDRIRAVINLHRYTWHCRMSGRKVAGTGFKTCWIWRIAGAAYCVYDFYTLRRK